MVTSLRDLTSIGSTLTTVLMANVLYERVITGLLAHSVGGPD